MTERQERTINDLPWEISIGGRKLTIQRAEIKLPSFADCQVWAYDEPGANLERGNGLIALHQYRVRMGDKDVDVLGLTPAATEIASDQGSILFISHASFEPSLIIANEPVPVFSGSDLLLFGQVGYLEDEGYHKLRLKGHLALSNCHNLVVMPLPPKKGEPGTGGILIVGPDFPLKKYQTLLSGLLVGRKFP